MIPRVLLVCLVLLAAAPAGAAPPAGGEMAPSAGGVIAWSAHLQRDFNHAVAVRVREAGRDGSWRNWAGLMALSFLYGVLHAVGPGHGKTVVASFLLARPGRVRLAVGLGAGVSLIQGAVAILSVGALGLVFGAAGLDVSGHTPLLEAVSYGLILLIGLVLLWQALAGGGHGAGCGCSHVHEHVHDRDHALPVGLGLGAGLIPCPSAVILMLFAIANGAFFLGVQATLALAAGMALTVAAVGVLSVFARRGLVRLGDRLRPGEGPGQSMVERGLRLAGALMISGLAGVMLAGSLANL